MRAESRVQYFLSGVAYAQLLRSGEDQMGVFCDRTRAQAGRWQPEGSHRFGENGGMPSRYLCRESVIEGDEGRMLRDWTGRVYFRQERKLIDRLGWSILRVGRRKWRVFGVYEIGRMSGGKG